MTGDSAGGQMTLSTGLAAEENGVILKGLAPVYPSTQESFNIRPNPRSSNLGPIPFWANMEPAYDMAHITLAISRVDSTPEGQGLCDIDSL